VDSVIPGRPCISIKRTVVTSPKQPNDFDYVIFIILNATRIVTDHSPNIVLVGTLLIRVQLIGLTTIYRCY